MAGRPRRQGGENALSAWPGYVDALSTLLMVIIFVMLVFFLAQAFLSVALSGRTKQLGEATRKAAGLSDALSSERGHAADLQKTLSRLNQKLAADEADRETLAQQLADSAQHDQTAEQRANALRAQLAEQARALGLLRDDLQHQAQDASTRADTEQQRRAAAEAQLADEKKRGDMARAQLAQLTDQLEDTKAQFATAAKALDLTRQQAHDKDTQIATLGQKLNTALSAKVAELQQYRSEFFGRLRALLANRSGVQVVGDRFVFQSEVLFPAGKADLTKEGTAQMQTLAKTINEIAEQIPADVPWVLRVDGHTDRQKIRKGSPFKSNWELSTARAISVVQLLIRDGVPAAHLAATGFGEHQPIAAGTSPEAYAKNRRIELRLTDR